MKYLIYDHQLQELMHSSKEMFMNEEDYFKSKKEAQEYLVEYSEADFDTKIPLNEIESFLEMEVITLKNYIKGLTDKTNNIYY